MDIETAKAYADLIEVYYTHLSNFLESANRSDRNSAVDHMTVMLEVAQKILNISMVNDQTNCAVYATELLQRTTQLSASILFPQSA